MSEQGRPPRASVRRPPGEGKTLEGSAAPTSGALAAAARQLGMSDQDIFDLALIRSAWHSMVVVRLGAGHARPAWSKNPMPALTNLAELGHASAFAGVDRQRILYDDSAPTELERAQEGNWGAVARRLGAPGGGTGATVASLASEFDRHLAPSIRQPRTRADYWRAWRLVVTWGVARKALGAVLPMSLTTLKALTWDLVCLAVPTSQVELVWKAVQARHRQFHLPPPMCEANEFSSGSGGGRGEAIRDVYYSDRQLPPGHDPGADSGEAPIGRQRGSWPLDILVECSATLGHGAKCVPDTTFPRS
jgi:hypothetical protein